MIPGSFHSCYPQFKPQQSGGSQLRGSGELWPHQLRPGISVPSIPTAGLQPGGPLLTPARQTPAAASWAAAETVCLPMSFTEGRGAKQAGTLDWDTHSTTVKETKNDLRRYPPCQHLGAPSGPTAQPQHYSPHLAFACWEESALPLGPRGAVQLSQHHL